MLNLCTGCVHGDLHMGNIMLDHDLHFYIIDFGLAWQIPEFITASKMDNSDKAIVETEVAASKIKEFFDVLRDKLAKQ